MTEPLHRPRRRVLLATAAAAVAATASIGSHAADPAASSAGSASSVRVLPAGPRVRLATSAGDIVVALDAAAAPRTVANFVAYAGAGHYDGTIFHRVIGNFMIQGGGFDAQMVQRPTRAPIPLEARNGLSNARGTIAMARTADPQSATSQFFINVADNSRLDAANAADGQGYAVFGRVVDGMDVVDRIRAVATGDRGAHRNVPLEAVVLRRASIER